jgi:hypothetical protein
VPELPQLDDDEEELLDPDEHYFRQCNPKFIREGQPSSQFLADFPRDEGKLSGTRSRTVNATESYLDFVGTGHDSAGTWGVTRDEVSRVESRLVDDSACAPTEPPRPRGHTYLDFRGFDRGERKSAVSKLLIDFHNRGQLAALGTFE